jgi:ATP-dependent exoDNAse (exonuclease V) alpha subunit
VDDLVTHDIFYTGVTRAKKYLKIYWEPESQEKILESFETKDSRAGIINKELAFLKQVAKERGIKL